MKCDKCSKEFSAKVLPMHYKDCKNEPKNINIALNATKADLEQVDYDLISYAELKKKVAEKGIKASRNNSKQELISLLKGE